MKSAKGGPGERYEEQGWDREGSETSPFQRQLDYLGSSVSCSGLFVHLSAALSLVKYRWVLAACDSYNTWAVRSKTGYNILFYVK